MSIREALIAGALIAAGASDSVFAQTRPAPNPPPLQSQQIQPMPPLLPWMPPPNPPTPPDIAPSSNPPGLSTPSASQRHLPSLLHGVTPGLPTKPARNPPPPEAPAPNPPSP
jgi:hypothetical protein